MEILMKLTMANPARRADVLLAAFNFALLKSSFLQERNAGPWCDISP